MIERIFERVKICDEHSRSSRLPNCEAKSVQAAATGQAERISIASAISLSVLKISINTNSISGTAICRNNRHR